MVDFPDDKNFFITSVFANIYPTCCCALHVLILLYCIFMRYHLTMPKIRLAYA